MNMKIKLHVSFSHNESFNATEIIVYQIAKNYHGVPTAKWRSDVC